MNIKYLQANKIVEKRHQCFVKYKYKQKWCVGVYRKIFLDFFLLDNFYRF